ncbi:MAG TPA: hypothetical protein V6D48_01675, partial [Oculatellaceae cyanobacterium]
GFQLLILSPSYISVHTSYLKLIQSLLNKKYNQIQKFPEITYTKFALSIPARHGLISLHKGCLAAWNF